MKNFLIVFGIVILVVIGIFVYKNQTPNQSSVTETASRPESTAPVTPTTTPDVSATSTDQAEVYLEQSGDGIKALEDLGVK